MPQGYQEALEYHLKQRKALLENDKRVLTWLGTVQKLYSKKDTVGLYVCLHSEAPKGADLDRGLQEVLRDMIREVDDKFTEIRIGFSRELLRMADNSSIPLSGDYPKYQAFVVIPVTVNDCRGKVQVGPTECVLNPDLVVTMIQQEHSRLFSLQPHEPTLLELVWKAYNRVLLAMETEQGQAVPLKEVHKELMWLRQPDRFHKAPSSKSFVAYDDAMFTADLFRVLRVSLSHRGWRVRLHPVRDPKEAYFVYSADGSGNYRGLISFQKEV